MLLNFPNALTCCNLICGCMATGAAFHGHFTWAFALIIAGAVFDFFDGMAARALGISSPIGKELDSLADVVTFGVAPSVMVCMWLTGALSGQGMPFFLIFLPLLMAAFSALRLAKFNLDERQTMGFIGLPTPANALFWGSLISVWGSKMTMFPTSAPIIIILMLLSCYLLVSEIPMFALKFKTWGWKGNEIKWVFLLSCIPLIVFFRMGSLAIIVAWYILLSVVTHRYQSSSSTPNP